MCAVMGLAANVFAANYCLDCDRGIAASKTYCTRCQNKRTKAQMEFAAFLLNGGKKPVSASAKNEMKRAAGLYLKKKYSGHFKVNVNDIIVKRTFTYNGGFPGAELTYDCKVRDRFKRATIKMIKKGSVWKVDSCRFTDF